MNIDDQIKEYLKKKPTVVIDHNKETGMWQYSVRVKDTDFWLDSFPSKAEATEYTKKHKLPVSRKS